MKDYEKCDDCKHQDDDLARIPGLTGCKKRLGVRYDKEGIMRPFAWTCFEGKEGLESQPMPEVRTK